MKEFDLHQKLNRLEIIEREMKANIPVRINKVKTSPVAAPKNLAYNLVCLGGITKI